jgi:hypothetical protein
MPSIAGQEYNYAHTDLGVLVRTAVMSGRITMPHDDAIVGALQRACDAHDALITQIADEAGVLALGGGRYDARRLLPSECA